MKKKLCIYLLMVLGLILFLTIGCKKNEDNNPINDDQILDNDGNVYNTITIGTQIWMKENLKTTKYRDGSKISNITKNSVWTTQTTGAYCWYNNDIANKATYGALYNWYTLVDSRNLCPTGWHVPSNAEWDTLITYLGDYSIVGGKLKATILWNNPNTEADNNSGFTALLGGFRDYTGGTYYSIGLEGYWWSVTEYWWSVEMDSATDAWNKSLYYNSSVIGSGILDKSCGFSVRCIKD